MVILTNFFLRCAWHHYFAEGLWPIWPKNKRGLALKFMGNFNSPPWADPCHEVTVTMRWPDFRSSRLRIIEVYWDDDNRWHNNDNVIAMWSKPEFHPISLLNPIEYPRFNSITDELTGKWQVIQARKAAICCQDKHWLAHECGNYQ